MNSNKCYKGGNQHKFEARYNEEPSGYECKVTRVYDSESLKNMMIIKKYVKDVCIWCGKEIKNE